MRTAVATLLGLWISVCGACGAGGPDVPLQVHAAASLRDALEALRGGPGLPAFELHVAGSELLLRQVRAGSPADLLIIARALTPEERALGGKAVTLLHNRLVVAVRADARQVPAGPPDLLALRRLAVADPDFAPAGQHARAALEAAGLWDRLEPALMFAANVRDACTWVVLGEAPAAVCYRSDVVALGGLAEAFALGSEPVSYEALVTAAPERRPAADALLAALTGPGSRDTFARYGFESDGR